MSALIVGLLVLGAALLVAEAHVTSYGALGATGTAAIIAAVALAVDDAGGSAALILAIVIPLALASGVLLLVAGRKVAEVSRRHARGGAEGLVGHVGVVRRALDPLGHVFVDGELWRAKLSYGEEDAPPEEGEPVVVERVQGLTLSVRRAEEWEVHG